MVAAFRRPRIPAGATPRMPSRAAWSFRERERIKLVIISGMSQTLSLTEFCGEAVQTIHAPAHGTGQAIGRRAQPGNIPFAAVDQVAGSRALLLIAGVPGAVIDGANVDLLCGVDERFQEEPTRAVPLHRRVVYGKPVM